MSARRPAVRQSRQRGNVAMLLAIILPLLLGFAALVIDLGHGWQVRNQQQNAVDSAALAGVRDLDGTQAQFNPAIASAVYYASLNSANSQSVTVPAANVLVGNWDFNARTFTPYGGAMAAYKVNAVQVTAPSLAVPTWFAPIIGVNSENVQTTAVAVGGSPAQTCGFPLAVPDCAIIDDNGQIMCNSTMTFGRATTDNVGFTLLSPSPPVDTPGINCEIGCALGAGAGGNGNGGGGGKCSCSSSCNSTAIANGQIYISNGNNLSQYVIDAINTAIAANPNGVFAQVPVLDSHGLTKSTCGGFQFNQDQTVVGYVEMKLVSASAGPPKTITVSVDCTRTGSQSPNGSGGFFGYKSTNVYLVK